MMTQSRIRLALAGFLTILLVGGGLVVGGGVTRSHRTQVVAYFDNSNGLFVGDDVRILGMPVGRIESIDAEPDRTKITFWFDAEYPVPADANAVVLSPALVTSRAIQLTPAYNGGPALTDGATIPQDRTAVPVEFDEFREQLENLTETLQPTEPGGVSTLGAFVSTAANNVRGEGANIRDTLIKLSQAFSILGDHSGDIFGTVKNLSVLVSALRDSTELMRQLNVNLSAASSSLADDPREVAQAVKDLNTAVADVQGFVADNREALGVTTDKLSGITTALVESIDDIKQTLHVAPNAVGNFTNIYHPAQGGIAGQFTLGNFADPISYICGAIQAASRLGGEQSSKLCVQYLAPIIKNRQYNSLPVGINPVVGAMARPNEITYSEDWMRPDYVPPPATDVPAGSSNPEPAFDEKLAAEISGPAQATDPAAGLPGIMIPNGGGS
jgi:phospholipid/cholesterol/gamma-HCH transport system substrate-binding protein